MNISDYLVQDEVVSYLQQNRLAIQVHFGPSTLMADVSVDDGTGNVYTRCLRGEELLSDIQAIMDEILMTANCKLFELREKSKFKILYHHKKK